MNTSITDIPETMKRATMICPKPQNSDNIEFSEEKVPRPGRGQVLLHIKKIGVCGSDIHVNHGTHATVPPEMYPLIQGHEYSAEIVETGDGVPAAILGKKAIARPQIVCGECPPCKRDDYHICNELKVEGFQAPGVAQDYFVTDESNVITFPDNFTHDQGTLVEPVSVAVHTMSRATEVKGKNVLVTGAGPIGNLVAQVAKANGAKKVLITDISDFRLEKATECKIDFVSNPKTEKLPDAIKRVFGNDGFDLAFECSAVQIALNGIVANINKGSEIIIVGCFTQPPVVDLAGLQDRELTLIGTLMYKHEDYENAVGLISEGKVLCDPLITDRFTFDQYLDAYNHIDENGEMSLKVIIDVND